MHKNKPNCTLTTLILDAGLPVKSAYTTGECAKILSVSQSTIIMLCDRWHPTIANVAGLECYRVGTHRRIPYHTLRDWVASNNDFNLQGAI